MKRRRMLPAVAVCAFVAALVCLLTAIWTADGWMTSQRLLATAGVLGFVALMATITSAAP